MKSSSQTVIGLPADRLDLRAWLAILSDRDYQACSPAHRAAGVFHENGVFGTMIVCCVLTMIFSAMTLGHRATSNSTMKSE